MWELDRKEGWAPNNWCFQTVVLEKTLGSPLDSKEIKPVNPKGNQPWIFIGRTDTETEAPILWPPDAKNRFIGKDLDAGKDWRQEEKGTTEHEMVGWHHWFNGHLLQERVKDRETWCALWGHKESDTAKQQKTTPGALPNSGIKLKSSALADGFFTTEPPGKPRWTAYMFLYHQTCGSSEPLWNFSSSGYSKEKLLSTLWHQRLGSLGPGYLFETIAWRIPGTGEPGGLLSMGLHRVGHDWSDLAAAAAA